MDVWVVYITNYINEAINSIYSFFESIHRGDYVLILSECFNSDNNGALKYFLDGLEIQRRSVIWMIFGIPVTLEMYERVGSLVSLLIAAIALILRSSA